MVKVIHELAGPMVSGNTEECWEFNGTLKPSGYGPYRKYYEYLVGPVPDGLVIDHWCRNRACVNPLHMEPITHELNTLRGYGPPAQNARKTHCQRGHEFTPENTLRSKEGWRWCRECKNEYFRAYNKKRSGKLLEWRKKAKTERPEHFAALRNARRLRKMDRSRHECHCAVCGKAFVSVGSKTCSRSCRGRLSTSNHKAKANAP